MVSHDVFCNSTGKLSFRMKLSAISLDTCVFRMKLSTSSLGKLNCRLELSAISLGKIIVAWSFLQLHWQQ